MGSIFLRFWYTKYLAWLKSLSAKLGVVGTQLMSPNSFLIVKNQQCIVFDNVLKIIIVYNFNAIIVT